MTSEFEKSKVEHINVGKPISGSSSKQKLRNSIKVQVSVNYLTRRDELSVVVRRNGRNLSQV